MNRGEMVIVGEHTGIECLTEANARLIAAAPSLLAALKQASAIFERLANGERGGEVFGSASNLRDAVNATISKAEGRA